MRRCRGISCSFACKAVARQCFVLLLGAGVQQCHARNNQARGTSAAHAHAEGARASGGRGDLGVRQEDDLDLEGRHSRVQAEAGQGAEPVRRCDRLRRHSARVVKLAPGPCPMQLGARGGSLLGFCFWEAVHRGGCVGVMCWACIWGEWQAPVLQHFHPRVACYAAFADGRGKRMCHEMCQQCAAACAQGFPAFLGGPAWRAPG